MIARLARYDEGLQYGVLAQTIAPGARDDIIRVQFWRNSVAANPELEDGLELGRRMYATSGYGSDARQRRAEIARELDNVSSLLQSADVDIAPRNRLAARQILRIFDVVVGDTPLNEEIEAVVAFMRGFGSDGGDTDELY